MSATKLKAPSLPERLTDAAVARYKSQLRAYDIARLKSGIATAGQIQEENSIACAPRHFRILSFPEARAE